MFSTTNEHIRVLLAMAAAVILLAPAVSQGRKRSGQAVSSIQYTDVAPRSQIRYRTNNNYTGRKYFPQPMCGGVAIFDYDQDGRQDIFLTNGAKLPELKKSDASFYNCLLRNKGDGSFEDVTEKAGLSGAELGYCFGVAAGDYDNDGFQDLFIANAGRNALYHNNGADVFTDVTDGSGLDLKEADLLSVGGAWFDYDNDGLLDLAVANYTNWNPNTDQRCLSEGQEIYCYPSAYQGAPQRLYRNLGRGRFADVTEKAGWGSLLGKGMGIGIADYNHDGAVDVFIANDTERNFLFINQKDGTFKEAALLYGVAYNDQAAVVSAMGSDAKDIDNDGWVDVFYNDISGQIFALFRNNAGKYFSYISGISNLDKISRPYTGWGCGFIDYNNDGWKDIHSANGELEPLMRNARQHDSMFENMQGRSFTDVSAKLGEAFMKLGYQRGSAFGDLNNDGFMDLVVTSLDEKPRILLNSGGNGAHWLLVALCGRQSNRDGIGAKIKVTTGSGRQLYNHVTTSVGFMSSSDKRAHFGLGGERVIKSVEIEWPSGVTQRLINVAADQILKVEEK